MDIQKVLAELSGIPGPSGHEEKVADKIAEYAAELADEVVRDSLLNVFGVKKASKPGAKKLLIDAHSDEVGMIITKREGKYLRFMPKGLDPRILPGREVVITSDPVTYGVVGIVPGHTETTAQHSAPLTADKLWIDTGLSEETLKQRIRVGTFAGFREKCVPLGKSRFSGKTMDDRACAVMLLRTLEILKDKELDVDVIMEFASQEEVGGKGAAVGAFRWQPDYAIAVDVNHARAPDANDPNDSRLFELGEGTPISMGPATTRKMAKRLLKLAAEQGDKALPDVMEGGTGTNMGAIQPAAGGTKSAVISLPLRYMHTAVEVVDLRDIESGAQLLAKFAMSLTGGEL